MLWAGERWRKTSVPKQGVLPAGTVWLVCARCGYQWFVRSGVLPVRCANRTCSSPYWHRARVRDYAAYAGTGSAEWVARHGDKIPEV
jgi:hypothetical protein